MMIDSFTGEYRFLSNFYMSPMYVPTLGFALSLEHAYQAMKVADNPPSSCDTVQWILDTKTPAEAKRLGRQVDLRDDWELVKIPIMRDLITLKFFFDTKLSCLLLATGNATLTEGNTWGDTFWGVCNGVGSNHLGRLLMERREVLGGMTYVK